MKLVSDCHLRLMVTYPRVIRGTLIVSCIAMVRYRMLNVDDLNKVPKITKKIFFNDLIAVKNYNNNE